MFLRFFFFVTLSEYQQTKRGDKQSREGYKMAIKKLQLQSLLIKITLVASRLNLPSVYCSQQANVTEQDSEVLSAVASHDERIS